MSILWPIPLENDNEQGPSEGALLITFVLRGRMIFCYYWVGPDNIRCKTNTGHCATVTPLFSKFCLLAQKCAMISI